MRVLFTISFFFLLLAVLPAQQTDSLATDSLSRTMIKEAKQLYEDGELDEALELFNQVLARQEATIGAYHIEYGEILKNVGYIYWEKAYYDSAVDAIGQSGMIIRKHYGQEHPKYGSSLLDMAKLLGEMHNVHEAMTLAEEALAIFTKKAPDHDDYLVAMTTLAQLQRETDDLLTSLENYEKALVLIKNKYGEDHEIYIKAQSGYASTCLLLGNYRKAITLYERSALFYKENMGEKSKAYINELSHLVNVYMNSGENEKALPILEKAIAIGEQVYDEKSIAMADLYNSLANFYMETGKHEKALPIFYRVLDITEGIFSKEHINYAVVLNNLANLYVEMKNFAEAFPIYEQVIELLNDILGEDHPSYMVILNNNALAYYENGDLIEAAKLYKEVTDLAWKNLYRNFIALSTEEKEHFFSSQDYFLNNFNLIVAQIGEQGNKYNAWAYENIIRYKNLILNGQIRVRENLLEYGSEEDLLVFDKWQEEMDYLSGQLSLPVSERDPGLDSVRYLINQYERELSMISAEFDRFQKDQMTQTSDVKAKLEKGEVAIEFVKYWDYVDSVNFYDALVVLPEQEYPIWVRLCKEDEIYDRLDYKGLKKADYVSRIYDLDRRGLSPAVNDGESMYKLIWQPMESLLSGVNKIYFSPAGLLHNINISALPLTRDSTLGDRYQLYQLSSTAKIIKNVKAKAKPSALIFSGIDYNYSVNPEDSTWIYSDSSLLAEEGFASHFRGAGIGSAPWQNLYYTNEEGEEIVSILNENSFSCSHFQGQQAREEKLREFGGQAGKSPLVIHLATHGYFFESDQDLSNSYKPSAYYNTDDPMFRSGLILAGANGAWTGEIAVTEGQKDGILTAREISLLDLRGTELVVMSACETGLGRIRDMEGVYGLQRAFKLAGVRYLIMSLWQVPDFQSKDLMVTFYRYWLEEDLPIPDAFRKAQQEMKNKYRDPYFWAGFVLME